jgi:hypothetical protein
MYVATATPSRVGRKRLGRAFEWMKVMGISSSDHPSAAARTRISVSKTKPPHRGFTAPISLAG